jgi:hypothetical protein
VGIRVADLYPKFLSNGAGSEWVDWGGNGDGSGEAEGEIGRVVPDDVWEDAVYFYGQDSTEANGEQYVPVGMVVTKLDFYTICTNSDYSVVKLYLCVPIQIDIKPGSYPNSINLKSQGMVSVAVLTTDFFDATAVDPVTVLFASAAPVRWATEDVDGDGDLDLVLHFEIQGLNLTAKSTAAKLTGRTLDGVYWIEGMDSVKIVGVKNAKCVPQNPGTGTPGYWMNHPDAWPTQWIVVIPPDEHMYSKYEAIDIMKASVNRDKTLTLFPAWVAAILNRRIGNDTSCVNVEIGEARYWLDAHPPGSVVTASSAEWKEAEPWYETLDAYNNGELCVQSRDARE